MTNEQTDCDVVIVQQAEARASAELMAADAQLAWRQDLKITAERELAAARRHSETAKIKWRSLADATAAAKVRVPHNAVHVRISAGELSWEEERRNITVLAISGAWAMVQSPGKMPYVCLVHELEEVDDWKNP